MGYLLAWLGGPNIQADRQAGRDQGRDWMDALSKYIYMSL